MVRSVLLAPAVAVVMLTGLTAGGTAVATASGCDASLRTPSLYGVAADSPSDAWAVGNFYDGTAAQTLIVHWDGSRWCVVPSPDPGGTTVANGLQSVSALSPTDAWAVGHYLDGPGGGTDTLILHWDGTSWTQVASPNPSPDEFNILSAVAADSATDAWAVGRYATDPDHQSLILHWNGTSWTQVRSPNPGPYDNFSAVAAASPSSAWAVGQHDDPTKTLSASWDGTAWQHVTSPSPERGVGRTSSLAGVAIVSASSAWAVGLDSRGPADNLILRWNGTAWRKVPTPQPGVADTGSSLTSVAATSASNAWAVGSYSSDGSNYRTFILRWNGTAWRQATSPDPGTGGEDELYSVAATSATDGWAVGDYAPTSSTARSLILHWDGTTWKRVTSP